MEGMSNIVKKVTQLMSGLIFMYGLYIITHGHLTPGGGFAGGAIVAGAFIILILAFGSKALSLKKEENATSVTESSAILIVLILAAIGMAAGAAVFFNNYLPLGRVGELISAGVIPLYNIFIGMEVAAALLTIFLAFVIYKEEVLK
ncbi:Multiple resistance and pH homeostasis protein B [Salinivirga cyanobacteriivorans]|uniref:Multiple resistance and pH homeostasis protein B n=1 Tax=Salinivirga cyanobacteriivorans TaxID=1307839 RepID=A0A0S2HYK4_9BACT|nr:MnhB domain-containing protein [Salinivirga cyanobacteriivorans]ALO14908.1 Multiple resistance and pH homeostasis protein B [Salinivirga cyanobacteriivorans]